jgi:hypothetical protein
MRVPRLISEFIEWRWAPCVGLTAGSLAFVALSLLLIPTQIESTPALADTFRTRNDVGAPQPRALFGASLAQSNVGMPQAARSPISDSVQNLGAAAEPAMQGRFSAVADLAQAPASQTDPPPPTVLGQTYQQTPEPDGAVREVTAH